MGRHSKKSKAKKADVKTLTKAKKKLKSKVKDARPQYTAEDLLQKVDECVESFQYELAVQFLERALALEPQNVEVLEAAGPLLLEMGHTDRAAEVLHRAVELNPGEGHSKYLYLGQMSSGEEAVSYLTKGIEIMTSLMQGQQAEECQVEGACASVPVGGEGEMTAEDISSAYCSLAEVYLTDSCFTTGAEQRCHECCTKAIEYAPHNPEAYQLMASCLLSQKKKEEAKAMLLKGVSLWLPSSSGRGSGSSGCVKLSPGSVATPGGQDSGISPPPYHSRVNCAKLLLELSEYDRAYDILEGLLCEDDEVVGVWYLLGWLSYLMEDHDSARFYLQQTEKLFSKLDCDEVEILEHTRELLHELGPEEGEGEGDGDLEEECSEQSSNEDHMDVT